MKSLFSSILVLTNMYALVQACARTEVPDGTTIPPPVTNDPDTPPPTESPTTAEPASTAASTTAEPASTAAPTTASPLCKQCDVDVVPPDGEITVAFEGDEVDDSGECRTRTFTCSGSDARIGFNNNMQNTLDPADPNLAIAVLECNDAGVFTYTAAGRTITVNDISCLNFPQGR
ncbi:hypothetical protein WR25_00574 [Diploscapter pachys]|uniref:C6 domain-containing protein n=1 Tax=Diploscapter pachys TaxID=2018661 RepID=A0A2A2JK35_9BILA|nr:hypothetical protein WR25_00574 [Diploscapter pachys]